MIVHSITNTVHHKIRKVHIFFSNNYDASWTSCSAASRLFLIRSGSFAKFRQGSPATDFQNCKLPVCSPLSVPDHLDAFCSVLAAAKAKNEELLHSSQVKMLQLELSSLQQQNAKLKEQLSEDLPPSLPLPANPLPVQDVRRYQSYILTLSQNYSSLVAPTLPVVQRILMMTSMATRKKLRREITSCGLEKQQKLQARL